MAELRRFDVRQYCSTTGGRPIELIADGGGGEGEGREGRDVCAHSTRRLINYTLDVAFVSSAVVTEGLLLFVHDQKGKNNNNNGAKIKHSAAQDNVPAPELVRNSIVVSDRSSGRVDCFLTRSWLPRIPYYGYCQCRSKPCFR